VSSDPGYSRAGLGLFAGACRPAVWNKDTCGRKFDRVPGIAVERIGMRQGRIYDEKAVAGLASRTRFELVLPP